MINLSILYPNNHFKTELPNAEITLIHPQHNYVPHLSKEYNMKIAETFKSRKVTVLMNERVKNVDGKPPETKYGPQLVILESGKSIFCDYLFSCIGAKPNTESLRASNLGHTINYMGLVIVNEHLQVVNVPNLFAAGDCIDVDETKLALNCPYHANVIVKNIISYMKQIKNGKEDPILPAKYVPHLGNFQIISMGKSGGVLERAGYVFGNMIVGWYKSKTMFSDKLSKLLNS